MVDEMQVFSSSKFGNVRTRLIDGVPWFVGKDIAAALGYANPQKAIRDHVDAEDRTGNRSFPAVTESPSTVNGLDPTVNGLDPTVNQTIFTADGKPLILNGPISVNGTPLTLINESGLYSLILSSKLHSAKEFKRWVTAEVLPMIRKTGVYASSLDIAGGSASRPVRELTPEDYLAAARIIASCADDRLKVILTLLGKGGWGVNPAEIAPARPASKNKNGLTEQLHLVKKECGLTLAEFDIELQALTGISADVLRMYHYGQRTPKQNRLTIIANALEVLRAKYIAASTNKG